VSIPHAKAAGRQLQYRRSIAELQAAARHRDALAEALRWLQSEVGHFARRRPRETDALCQQLTDRIITLAAAVADFDAAAAGHERRNA
jgi:hypothetical protein